jgi:hypothetical protein
MTSPATTLALLAVSFSPQPGWHTGHHTVRACPGVAARRCVQSDSWAATTPWRGCGACLPHQMVASLPPAGIVLQVDVAVERPLVARSARAWPPTIRANDLSGIEGVPSRYAVYQLSARFGHVEAYVWAFFGRTHPTPKQLAAANLELASARLRR